MIPLTEAIVINGLLNTGNRYVRNFCLPRYTPLKWFEMDLCEITPKGTMREYEVKLTRADFRADANKAEPGQWRLDEETQRAVKDEGRKKHARLALSDTHGPSRFWYVVPQGLNVQDILPPWAGLMEVWKRGSGTWINSAEIVKAPKLHNEPVDQKLLEHARGITYWRYHRLLSLRHVLDVSEEEKEGTPSPVQGGNPLGSPGPGT